MDNLDKVDILSASDAIGADWRFQMNGDGEAVSEVNSQDDPTSYERSTIQFPYFDLGSCLKLAEAMQENVGGGECNDDQLAPWIDLSPKSSGYRSRISAARLFGIIEPGHEKDHRLSELGLAVLDKDRAREAKAKAFLKVPLFKKVYEDWRGQQMPPAAALERAFVTFGVANKQTARARQILERSAAEAGFFEQGRDKLVMPGYKVKPKPPADPGGGGGDGGGGGRSGFEGLDPVIRGLIEKLPAPNSVWPDDQRKLWLSLLEGSFKLIYKEAKKADNGMPE